MTYTLTELEFIDKIEFEGGVLQALEYGLHLQDLDDHSTPLALAWRELETVWRDQLTPALQRVEGIIDDRP